MILIDKNQAEVTITLTLSEHLADSTYTMNLHATATGVNYTVPLGTNVSENKSRYDRFVIDSAVFFQMPGGRYTYEVYTGGNSENVIERGTASIIELPFEETFVSLSDETADDAVVYYGDRQWEGFPMTLPITLL